MTSLRIIAHLLTLLLISLALLGSPGKAVADESKFSGGFLNLEKDSDQYSSQRVLEFWGYHNTYGEQIQSDTAKLRYYQPLKFDQWRGTMRLDTSYVSTYGPASTEQSSGNTSLGNTLLTVWGNHPNILKNWEGTLGGRIVFPFGNYGQWAAGPQIGTIYVPPKGSDTRLSDFSPLLRYMYGFNTKGNSFANNSNQPPLARNLNIFPTIGLNILPGTQIRFWDENAIVWNTGGGGGWFVPLDAMVTHRLNKDFLFAIGASKQVVQSYPVYDWSFYGKLSFNF
jgi:hypothetical protein